MSILSRNDSGMGVAGVEAEGSVSVLREAKMFARAWQASLLSVTVDERNARRMSRSDVLTPGVSDRHSRASARLWAKFLTNCESISMHSWDGPLREKWRLRKDGMEPINTQKRKRSSGKP